MDTWEVADINKAKQLIGALKNQVKSLSEASSSSEDSEHTLEEEKKVPLNQPNGQ